MRKFVLVLLLLSSALGFLHQNMRGQTIIVTDNPEDAWLKAQAQSLRLLLDVFGDSMTNYFITPGNWPGLARVYYNSLWQVDSIIFRSTFNENCKNPNAEKLVKEYIRKMPYIFTPYELFNRYVQGKNIILFAQFMIPPYSMEEGWDRKRFSRLQYDKQRMEEINRMPVIDIYGHTYY